MQKMKNQRGFIGTLAIFALALFGIIAAVVSKSSSEGSVSTSAHDAKATASMLAEQAGTLKNGVTIMRSGLTADVQGLYLDTTAANDPKLKVQTALGVQDGGYPMSVPSLSKGLSWQFYNGATGVYAFVDNVPANVCTQVEVALNNPSATSGAVASGDSVAAGTLAGGAVATGAVVPDGANTTFDGVTSPKSSCVVTNAGASTGRFIVKLQ